MEGIQYCGGIPSVLWEDNISTVGDNISTVGDNISTVGDNITTVEGIQYRGGIILISVCLVISNDEKISTFLCITI